LKLLIDNNLSHTLAQSLQPLIPEHEIVALREKLRTTTQDVDWIKSLDIEGGWACPHG
jgi:hypothetical protein